MFVFGKKMLVQKMRFLCPFCNFIYSVDESALGCRVVCGACRKSVMVPASPFSEGRVIGDFAIRTKLGEGSIGAVYKAYQMSLERIVALKVLTSKYMTAKGQSEFLREARAAAKLIHTNLVQSFAVGEEEGVCYMAMTYINGETLKARIKRDGKIPCDEALHIVQQVAEALHYAWTESRIIHRDVKPDNIMLSDHGIVKLTDLGLAINQAEWYEGMDISGSPSYMSPEQFAGEKLDTRSDIYSLGVTLYQMLAGKLPFDGETIQTIAKQHFEANPPPLSQYVALPSNVTALVKKMMAKMPEKRFNDMEEVLQAIWKIRQKTAPNRDFVPDVHTISMKRLDYDMQTQSITTDDKGAPSPEHAKRGLGTWLMLPLIGLPLLILVLLISLMLLDKQDAFLISLNKDVSMLETLADDPSLPVGE